jgi:hypothetical protein
MVEAPVLCVAGCNRPVRSMAAILSEVRPDEELKAAAEVLLRLEGSAPTRAAAEWLARRTIVPKLTRQQLELNGYCRHCALKGQIMATDVRGTFERLEEALHG